MRLQAPGAVIVLCVAVITFSADSGPRMIIDGQPVKWNVPEIKFDLEAGELNSDVDEAEVEAAVRRAAAAWNGIDTSTIRLQYQRHVESSRETQADIEILRNRKIPPPDPVVWLDTTGETFGGAVSRRPYNSPILHARTFSYRTAGTSTLISFVTIVNGPSIESPAHLAAVLLHEFGEALGLAHAQINWQFEDDGVASNNRNIPRMYPNTLRPVIDSLELHPDDRASVSALYPSPEFAKTFERIRGRIVGLDLKPVSRANVIAVKVQRLPSDETIESDLYQYSTVTGCIRDDAGRFELWVIPGVYRLYVESVRPGFFGLSHVGPSYPNTQRECENATVSGKRLVGEIDVAIGTPGTLRDLILR